LIDRLVVTLLRREMIFDSTEVLAEPSSATFVRPAPATPATWIPRGAAGR
jgi:hypothetical protein